MRTLFFISLLLFSFQAQSAFFYPSVHLGGVLNQPTQYNTLSNQHNVDSVLGEMSFGGALMLKVLPYFLVGVDYRTLYFAQPSKGTGSISTGEVTANVGSAAAAFRFYKDKSYFGLTGTYSFYQQASFKIKDPALTTTLDNMVYKPAITGVLDIGWRMPTSLELWLAVELGYQDFIITSSKINPGGAQGPVVNLDGFIADVKLVFAL